MTLAGRARLENPWANVWVITEADSGLSFEGTPDDVVVFRLSEHASGGYLWDETELARQGFELLADEREQNDGVDCGGPVVRVVIARVRQERQYRVSLSERRPWMPSAPGSTISVGLEMFGKEEGLPRHVRRAWAAS